MNVVVVTESLTAFLCKLEALYPRPSSIHFITLHAMGPYMGPTGRTHGKAKVTFSPWYSSKIVDVQQLIDYLAL